MYHSVYENILYDFVNKKETIAELYKGRSKYDILTFLDDISLWLEHNKEYVSNKYLPFAVLAVGDHGPAVGAFLYGMFIGKVLTDKKVNVKIKKRDMSSKEVKKMMQDDLNALNDMLEEEKEEDDYGKE